MEAYAYISQKILIDVTLELFNGFQFPCDNADLVDCSVLSRKSQFQLFSSPLGPLAPLRIAVRFNSVMQVSFQYGENFTHPHIGCGSVHSPCMHCFP